MFSKKSVNNNNGEINNSPKKNKPIVLIITIAVVICVTGIIIACLSLNTPERLIDNYYENATKYLAQMNYEQAIVEFDKILEIDPMNVEAYLGKAQAYYEMGNIDKAIEILEHALSIVDDERIRKRLNELYLIKNPPPVVTQQSEPVVEEIDNGYVDYETLAVTKKEFWDLGAGINYIKNEDSTYSLVDIKGNKLSNENYVKLYKFFESECGSYAVVCPDEATKIIVNDKLETVIDISDAYSWQYFDEVNGLVAVMFSGTVTKHDGFHDEEYETEENIARLEIYKLDTAELLYRWNYNDWIEGENSEIDLYELNLYDSVIIEEMYCESCGGRLAIDNSDIYINERYSMDSSDNKFRIPFSINVDFYITNMEEIEAEWEREDERRMQEAHANGYSYIRTAHNIHGHSSGLGLFEYYEAVYKDGKIVIEKSSTNGEIAYYNDEYMIYNINNLPTLATELQLSENNKNSYLYHSSEIINAANGQTDEFEWIVNIYRDVVIGGRNTPETENSVDIAFFKPVWYDDRETAKEKSASEWVRISEWFPGILNYDVNEDGFRLGRYKENSTEEEEHALFGYNETGDGIVQLSDWYDYLSWDEGKYSLVEKNEKWGYIDSDGKEVKMYDDASPFVNGYAMVTTNGKAIIVDEDFNQLSEEFEADSVSSYGNDMFRIKYKDKFTFICINE